ncbi:FAD-dependent monooxygenase [Actinomadura flavalba]|uniref:FAD-dependent monooxygenase n=1 Tax=Actinomadura flavalba TaxID=1120938 RepID=UPI000362F2EB|nr:FAD-dependent monooxygenase [Actinomadura flavalba]
MPGETNIVLVGAGPTGLLLAGDLAAAGLDVTVLERRADESNLTRAFAVHARTLELLDMRGVAGELLATGTKVPLLRLPGGARLDLSRLPGHFPYVLITPQYETERVLTDRALAAGARIEYGTRVTGLRQDDDGVTVYAAGRDGPARGRRAAYVVGADGAHSTVRDALGLPFPGRAAVRSVMLADVRLTDPPGDVLAVGAARGAFGFLAPFGDGRHRAIAWNDDADLDDDVPVDVDDLRATLRRALGTDHGLHDPSWTSRFHSDERQVPRYRVHRVFLAGDAAHVHSPVGGQGMNVGLQDAANLSWRLVAAARGDTGLLDGYQRERHPVGRAVLLGSGAMLRGARLRAAPLRAARDALLRAVTGTPPLARRVARAVSGIGIAYDAPRGSHRLTGRRAPDVALDGPPGRLFAALREGRFVLVVAADDPAVTYLATRLWAGRVHCAVAGAATRTTALVRPDGYVAWATDATAPEHRAAEIRAALTRWCGPPVHVRPAA